ncbi:MAG: hypothetical protein ACI97A_000077 [Planctomycetota bacterium]|jgi:hypothetical protein
MNRLIILIPTLCICAVLLTSMKQTDASLDVANGNPVELGLVSWGRDLDAAIKLAKQKKQDVFLLFQEVPG